MSTSIGITAATGNEYVPNEISVEEKKDVKEEIRIDFGIPGTRMTSFLMVIMWAVMVTLRETDDIKWSRGTDCTDDACQKHSSIYRVA